MRPRLLSKEEKQLLADALRAAAAETRRTRHAASAHSAPPGMGRQAYIDSLDRRAQAQDRLASEISELDVRLEKVLS